MLCAILFLVSCNETDTTQELSPAPDASFPDLPADVVATYEPDGTVTLGEVEASILSLPEKERTPGEVPFDVWYAERIKEVFLAEVLLAAAVADGIEKDPSIAEELRLLKVSHFTDARVRQALAKAPPITEEDVRARYEERKGAFEKPETRLVYHIFLRLGPESSQEQLFEKLASVRERVAKGENFGVLARSISQSETRHRSGMIGTIEKGQLAEPADSVVFSLAEGATSDPVPTEDGVHLFFNENTTAASVTSMEDLRSTLLRELVFLRKRAALQGLAAECPILAPHFFPDEAALRSLMKKGKKGEVVLALGTFELTLGELESLVGASDSVGASGAMGDFPAYTILDEVKNREILYQSMLASGGEEVRSLETTFEPQKNVVLIEAQKRRQLTGWLQANPGTVRESYRIHQKRFQTPPRIHLRGIRVPLTEEASSRMARLEASREELSQGKMDFSSLAGELEGESADWGWFYPEQLNRRDPLAARSAFGMKVGEVSSPYRLNETLNLFQVTAIEPAEPIAFDQAFPQVVQLVLKTRGAEIYSRVREELVSGHQFRIIPDRIPSLIPPSVKPAS